MELELVFLNWNLSDPNRGELNLDAMDLEGVEGKEEKMGTRIFIGEIEPKTF